LTGGFPAVINEYLNAKFVNKQEIIKNELYETMIRIVLGDVSKIGRSEIIATEIMKGIVKRYSTRYSFTKIGSDIGFPHQTVIDYLEILENSFMLQVLYPFDISSMKIKFKGDKKIYFSDPFIYHAVNSFVTGAEGFALSKETLLHDKDKLVESVVMNHLSQAKEVPYLKEWKNYLGFFYSATGRETDFIYKRNDNTLVGVEVKYREEAERELAKMDKIKEYLVLTKNQLKISDGVAFIPVSLFLVLLEKSEKLI
jgi:predicted AAA+ superfamily ATPase